MEPGLHEAFGASVPLWPAFPDTADALRTLKQHYYPEGGWGWMICLVTLLVQILAHGTQIGLAVYMNGVVTSGSVTSAVTLTSRPSVTSFSLFKLTRRLFYGHEVDASKSDISATIDRFGNSGIRNFDRDLISVLFFLLQSLSFHCFVAAGQ